MEDSARMLEAAAHLLMAASLFGSISIGNTAEISGFGSTTWKEQAEQLIDASYKCK